MPDEKPPLGSGTRWRAAVYWREMEPIASDAARARRRGGQFGTEVVDHAIDGADGIHGIVELETGGSRVITISAGMVCIDDRP